MNHIESTYLRQVVSPAKSYCLFEYITVKDSERVAVAAWIALTIEELARPPELTRNHDRVVEFFGWHLTAPSVSSLSHLICATQRH